MNSQLLLKSVSWQKFVNIANRLKLETVTIQIGFKLDQLSVKILEAIIKKFGSRDFRSNGTKMLQLMSEKDAELVPRLWTKGCFGFATIGLIILAAI